MVSTAAATQGAASDARCHISIFFLEENILIDIIACYKNFASLLRSFQRRGRLETEGSLALKIRVAVEDSLQSDGGVEKKLDGQNRSHLPSLPPSLTPPLPPSPPPAPLWHGDGGDDGGDGDGDASLAPLFSFFIFFLSFYLPIEISLSLSRALRLAGVLWCRVLPLFPDARRSSFAPFVFAGRPLRPVESSLNFRRLLAGAGPVGREHAVGLRRPYSDV
ncbi:hypothetical protein NL676_008890 [Syzygium grande]|nr:hypothetical protein NL676_008890 [Syzygium grande]